MWYMGMTSLFDSRTRGHCKVSSGVGRPMIHHPQDCGLAPRSRDTPNGPSLLESAILCRRHIVPLDRPPAVYEQLSMIPHFRNQLLATRKARTRTRILLAESALLLLVRLGDRLQLENAADNDFVHSPADVSQAVQALGPREEALFGELALALGVFEVLLSCGELLLCVIVHFRESKACLSQLAVSMLEVFVGLLQLGDALLKRSVSVSGC